MATKPKAKAKRKTKPKTDPRDALIDAAYRLAAEQGWHGLGLADIAAAAKISPGECSALFSDKTAILAASFARVDRLMDERLAEQGTLDPGAASARERLFDVIMTRLEIIQPHRLAMARIVSDLQCDPAAMLHLWPQIQRSLNSILRAAGLDTSGLRGMARRTGLGFLLSRVRPVWLRDDSLDMGPTMAALDRGLLRIESLLNYLRPLAASI